MARVKIQKIIESLNSDMTRALEDAIKNEIPNAEFDRNRLFREFARAVGRKCSTWKRVSDSYVEMD